MACRIRTNRQRRVDLVTSCSLAFSNIRILGCLLEMREGETCFLSFFEFFLFLSEVESFHAHNTISTSYGRGAQRYGRTHHSQCSYPGNAL